MAGYLNRQEGTVDGSLLRGSGSEAEKDSWRCPFRAPPPLLRPACQTDPRSTVTKKGAAALITPVNISPSR